MTVSHLEIELPGARGQMIIRIWPAAAAIAYPFLLALFHALVSPTGGALSGGRIAGAVLFLGLAFAVPLSGLVSAYWQNNNLQLSQANLRARRLAYACIATPPLFVLLGVLLGLLGLQLPDLVVWTVMWFVAGCYVWSGENIPLSYELAKPNSVLRIVHGISAAMVTIFVLFHLTNHLFGLAGPGMHAVIMKAGRTVYRAPLVEPLLVALLLFQVGSGVRLAWQWSGPRTDAYRVFQVGSGAYLAAFIVAHMNSALVYARAVHKIDTNWAWASGAPSGLIHDPWNIRLLPHYALGVFFILGHLTSGLRIVMIAHGVTARVANRIWIAGLLIGAGISMAIVAALCGLRV